MKTRASQSTTEQIEAYYGRKIIMQIFDNLHDYHGYLDERCAHYHYGMDNLVSTSSAQFRAKMAPLISDYRVHEKQINDLIEKMNEDDLFATGLPMPERAYYGSRVNVGAYLSGLPKAMYRRFPGEHSSISTPINIFVNINLSGSLDDRTMAQKGIAIAALALALNASRPVTVYTVKPLFGYSWETKIGVISMVKLNDAIIDIGRMDFAMTNGNFHRDISWTSCAHAAHEAGEPRLATPGAWPFDGNIDSDEYNDCVKKFVGCTENDIFIPGSAVYNLKLVADPIAWIKAQINKHKTLVD